jgi:hypothetical protein
LGGLREGKAVQLGHFSDCRSKMRMSYLGKVEMSY